MLVAARGDLVGQQPALQVGQPGVERGAAGGVDRHRVDQHPLAAVHAAREHDGVLLPGLAARQEPPPGPPQRRAHRAGVEQGVHPRGQRVAAGQLRELARGQLVLRARPGDRARVGRVLQPAVGVGDAVAVQDVDDVEAWSGGVDVGLPHADEVSVTPWGSRALGVAGPVRRPARAPGAMSRPTAPSDVSRRRHAVSVGSGSRRAEASCATGSTPAQRPPAAMSSSSSPGGPVRTLTLASARSSATTAVAASSLAPGWRACSQEPGDSCSTIARSAASRSSASVTSRARRAPPRCGSSSSGGRPSGRTRRRRGASP